MVSPVQFPNVGALQGVLSREGMPAVEAPAKGEFDKLVSQALKTVDQQIQTADAATLRYLQGEGDLHDMALSLEKADLSFKLLTRVRNRVIEAYKEITRINI